MIPPANVAPGAGAQTQAGPGGGYLSPPALPGSLPGGILALVLREGLLVVLAGLAVGLAGALAVGRAMQAQLYGVGSADPLVLGGVSMALMVVALIACAVPARRASRIDPVVALAELAHHGEHLLHADAGGEVAVRPAPGGVFTECRADERRQERAAHLGRIYERRGRQATSD